MESPLFSSSSLWLLKAVCRYTEMCVLVWWSLEERGSPAWGVQTQAVVIMFQNTCSFWAAESAQQPSCYSHPCFTRQVSVPVQLGRCIHYSKIESLASVHLCSDQGTESCVCSLLLIRPQCRKCPWRILFNLLMQCHRISNSLQT